MSVLNCFQEGNFQCTDGATSPLDGMKTDDFLFIEDETSHLVWASYCSKVIRRFPFIIKPLQAVFCSFSTSDQENRPKRCKAVAVLCSQSELQIHYYTGEKYEIRLPVPVKCIISTSYGLLFRTENQSIDVPQILHLSHPASALSAVLIKSPLNELGLDQEIIGVDGNYLTSINSVENELILWEIEQISVAAVNSFTPLVQKLDESSMNRTNSTMNNGKDPRPPSLNPSDFSLKDRFINSPNSENPFTFTAIKPNKRNSRSPNPPGANSPSFGGFSNVMESSNNDVFSHVTDSFSGRPSFTPILFSNMNTTQVEYEIKNAKNVLNSLPDSELTDENGVEGIQMLENHLLLPFDAVDGGRWTGLEVFLSLKVVGRKKVSKGFFNVDVRFQNVGFNRFLTGLESAFYGGLNRVGGWNFIILNKTIGNTGIFSIKPLIDINTINLQDLKFSIDFTVLNLGDNKLIHSFAALSIPLTETENVSEKNDFDSIPMVILSSGHSTEVFVVVGNQCFSSFNLQLNSDFDDFDCDDDDSEVDKMDLDYESNGKNLVLMSSLSKNQLFATLHEQGSIKFFSLSSVIFTSLKREDISKNKLNAFLIDVISGLLSIHSFPSEWVDQAILLLWLCSYQVDSIHAFWLFLNASLGLTEFPSHLNLSPSIIEYSDDIKLLYSNLCQSIIYKEKGENEGKDENISLLIISTIHVILEELKLNNYLVQVYNKNFKLEVFREVKELISTALTRNFQKDSFNPAFKLLEYNNSSSIDALSWFEQSIITLSTPIPPSNFLPPHLHPRPVGLKTCPALTLSFLFFQHLGLTLSTSTDVSPAIRVIDAFVYSVHGENGKCGKKSEFILAGAGLPRPLWVLVQLSLGLCRNNPRPEWPDYLLAILSRNDLCDCDVNKEKFLAKRSIASTLPDVASLTLSTQQNQQQQHQQEDKLKQLKDFSLSDGLVEVEETSHLRFTEDDRFHEVCRMLRSSYPLYLKVEKSPELSELDYRQKLQMRLLLICRRTFALSVGRGMLTLASLEPVMAAALPVPPLSTTGRVPPSNYSVTLDVSSANNDLTLWPEFHNGVAAALRVGSSPHPHGTPRKTGAADPKGRRVTRNWILYNRTASQAATGGESAHAGFLLGLGLQGHLQVLTISDIYEYLAQGHEPTTIAILIGMAASKIRSADQVFSKTVCLHLPALLPAQHSDLEISPLKQTAALVSMGLLYCESGHRLMAELLLTELSQRPAADRCEVREASALAAGWALGMVLLGKGGTKRTEEGVEGKVPNSLRGLADLRIEERLLRHIEGGKRPPDSSLFPSHDLPMDMSSRSSRVLEGDKINVGVTALGATIALALLYIKSGDLDMLGRLPIPKTVSALDSVRPDLLIYRALARCLILWDGVEPTEEWVNLQIPTTVKAVLFPEGKKKKQFSVYGATLKGPPELEPKTALLVYLCILSGHCFGIGLIYAGTADERAKTTLLYFLRLLQSFRDLKPKITIPHSVMDKSTRQTVEMCTCLIALSVGCVMAGSGDLDTLRLLRELRWKIDDVMYGTHMALSMAIGLLFLGGGNFSLRRDPLSVACLLLSLCPRYPSRTVDQQYHLQPWRHLYVLAVEQRALHTVDIESGQPVRIEVKVEKTDGTVSSVVAPGLLPELDTIRRVYIPDVEESMVGITEGAQTPVMGQYFPTSLVIPKQLGSRSIGFLPPLFVQKRPMNQDLVDSSNLSFKDFNINAGEIKIEKDENQNLLDTARKEVKRRLLNLNLFSSTDLNKKMNFTTLDNEAALKDIAYYLTSGSKGSLNKEEGDSDSVRTKVGAALGRCGLVMDVVLQALVNQ